MTRNKTNLLGVVGIIIWLLLAFSLNCNSQKFYAKPVLQDTPVKVNLVKINSVYYKIIYMKDGVWICTENYVEWMSFEFYNKWRRKNKLK